MPRAAVDEYPERRASWTRMLGMLNRQDAAIARGRLVLFGAAVVLLVLATRGVLSGWWLAVPVAGFAALIKRHERVIRRRDAAARLVDFYARGLARLENRWIGTGETGEQFLDPDHLYAADLDLFGRGSLFELLSLARTRAGEATLADWLTRPAPLETLTQRHEAVAELRTALDLRESLALAGATVRRNVHSDALAEWVSAAPMPARTARWAVAGALTIALPVLVYASWQTGWLTPLIVAALLRAVYQHVEGPHIERLVRRADTAAHDLNALSPALELLEEQTFASLPIVALQRDLVGSTPKASAAIRTLVRYGEMHDWAHNIVFTPVAALVMWDTHLAWAMERWRARHGRHALRWLQIVGEFEALSSLAAYAYEHPEDPFPTLVSPAGPIRALFDGTALGHPLLPDAQMVRNDVHLDDRIQLLVISGSNMSGKSTLLRTVGVNAVLALAGAPVRATSLRISPMAIGATLRIQDSLQQGRSRFFAEITRLREIAGTAPVQPLLFLLDELFHGTNSHDRLVGAAGVLRSLLDQGAIGMITTHDLALTAITAELGSHAANVHFEDAFDGIEMSFDYRLKPGPVTRSNALALMRAVGLDVGEDAR